MPYKFSPSSLSLLKECPRCFWLLFNKEIKRPVGIFPSLPSGMDGILKKYFDSYMAKGELPPDLQLSDVRLFSDTEKLNAWRSNFKGISWTDENGNILRGAVDNILVKGSKLIVLDYKTRGYPLKEDTADHYQDQMDLYNFLLRKNGYETEDYAYLLFYHPNTINANGDVLFNTDLVKMNVNVSNAEGIFNNALTILKGEIPQCAEGCEYCRWGRECGGV
jgi:hypothetical protein